MGRLIDADELIKYLKKVTITDGITFETGFKQILTDIQNQPTAYDVSKIIYRLKQESYMGLIKFGVLYSCGIDRAIEILEKGGTL